ncbi:exodeoxyribonuclease VII large subunit [Clostridium omnivorum]|uniref:Exodeoxyribonuclease 7 large subunit n=1 Tax=Clostridium omnivorum TaxID=1604902 RepID=A0ABQ5NB65_9CLOT|nr:exodeoxyribonuclease VII large subunit [Clostridium sp. E14]GLC32434.1 exodeoxyribonuclease 7 large subunit [Clostridium sp. E14]
MHIKTLTVSALNNYVKKILDSDFILSNISVKGELSNFKHHSSGHLYFSLKDDYSKINCIMFRSQASQLKFMPENGMKVVLKGRISVYEKDGTYQMYCTDMVQEGLGELYLKFQQLKDMLEREGLFDLDHKRPIPKYPRRIGVITSPTGAAVRDIINVASRRNKGVDILLYPALVQGENSSEDLIRGINALNKCEDIDVIILARGGGSIEELWSFNDEKLAYAVYNSKKPVITGVGHETDFTIVDFVSDRRAPTPSAAAELAVPNTAETLLNINGYKKLLISSLSRLIQDEKSKINFLYKSLQVNSPQNYVINQYNYIDKLNNTLYHNTKLKLSINKEYLSKLYEILQSKNPLNILNRGYAVIEDLDENVISEVERLKQQEQVKVILKDGNIRLKISEIDAKSGK